LVRPPNSWSTAGRPTVRIIDSTTVRYTWDKPNPDFIGSQARAAPLFLFRPSHYLKKFHKKYTPEKVILKSAEGGERAGGWADIHRRLDAMYADDNVALPTLNPWVNTTPSPTQRLVFVRNPYFHRIDTEGQQLPYIDHVVFAVTATNLVPVKAGLGAVDLQARYLSMRDYTFLERSARVSHIDVRLWEVGSGSELALYPNFNANDEVWRDLMRDVRFRRALSVGIDRDELNQVIYSGLAVPSNNTVMRRSPLFRPDYATRWATYNLALANRLMDECGLSQRDSDGFRKLPNGRRATIVVEHVSERTVDVDTLQLIADDWRRIGIEMLSRPQPLANFRRRVLSGDSLMTAHAGVVTAAPTVDTSPREFAPTMEGGLQWPRWGMYYESGGKEGDKCDWRPACSLLDYLEKWEQASGPAGRRRAWHDILEATAEGVFSIGTVNGTRQPVVVGPRVRNVPRHGYYAWNPGGYFGLYRPETFWIN
jgi:peptide/nickel transport system substrate-binding protein